MSSASLKEMRNGGEDYSNGHGGGGVRDLYGEDCATEDQLITPWTFSVARYHYMPKKTIRNLSFCIHFHVWICVSFVFMILFMWEF